MSTPIAYTTMTINEALGYNTAIHTTGEGLLDGWLGISGYRGGATPQLIDPEPIWNRILAMTNNGAASMYLGSHNCGYPLGERLRQHLNDLLNHGLLMRLNLFMRLVKMEIMICIGSMDLLHIISALIFSHGIAMHLKLFMEDMEMAHMTKIG